MPSYTTIRKRYSVEDYSPSWPLVFESIQNTLKRVFKNEMVRIEHVGSTSVEGMMAKPIIDVLVIVHTISSLEDEVLRMQALGYLCTKEYIAERSIFFRKDVGGVRLENIHVFPADHPHAAEMLETRDYLRSHPEEIVRYSSLKMSLAKAHPNDYVQYRKGKDAYLDTELAEKVRKWKLEAKHVLNQPQENSR